MIDIDRNFIMRLNTTILAVTHKGNGIYNCRCPLCGDSQKNKYKMRGYLMPGSDHYIYHCHNCGVSTPFRKLLEQIDISLYNEYLLEVGFKPKKQHKEPEKTSQPTTDIERYFSQLVCVSDLITGHPAYQYCLTRKIPASKVYYTSDFVTWAKQFVPEKFNAQNNEYGMIVFPLRNQNCLFGFQARRIDDALKMPKFMTVVLDKTQTTCYGLDVLDFSKQIYCTEAIIDSLHLPNSIAAMTSTLSVLADRLKLPKNAVMCHDNERNNQDIIRQYGRSIRKGYNVFVWPTMINTFKDFNEMAMSGVENGRIKELVDQNTFSGPTAELAFNQWRNLNGSSGFVSSSKSQGDSVY